MALHVLLNFQYYDDGTQIAAFGAFVGMSGWLPFAYDLRSAVWGEGNDREEMEDRVLNIFDPIVETDDDPSARDIEKNTSNDPSSIDLDSHDDQLASNGEENAFAEGQRREEAELDSDEDDDDPFERGDDDEHVTVRKSYHGDEKYTRTDGGEDLRKQQLIAADFVRDIIDLPPLPFFPLLAHDNNKEEKGNGDSRPKPSYVDCPCFLGHGTADKKVSVNLGEETRDVLARLGVRVTWKSYEGFGHWWKEPDEIDHLVEFLSMVGI